MSTNSDERNWYLRDEPLEYLDEEDQFRHKGYVQVLFDAVRELSPPFTLGIFGGWGVGKTSIVRDFCNSISKHETLSRIPVACIDVWKYEKDSLRRQFLLDVESQLKKAKTALPEDYSVQAQLYATRTEEGQTEPRFSWRRLKDVKWLLLEVLLIVAAGLFLISLLPINQPLQIVFSSLLIPVLLYFIPRLSRVVVVQQKHITTEPALFSSEQFEKAFEDMVKATPCEKMVIIIDNLDRCSRDRVVEVLGVVKTYLEPKGKDKCIFIIPCDDSAIKEQVKATYAILDRGDEKTDVEGYADEYLRKFFNASICITPFIEKEIESYIETLLGKIRLTESMADEQIKQLVQMIGFVFRKNPRRIKQFLNNLTSKYLLIKEREAGTIPMIDPPISDNILFLTKVSIIETKFPEQFQEFLTDDNLYGEVIRSVGAPQQAKGKAADVRKDDDLRHFLVLTKHVTSPNYKAFFHLKQSPHEAKIPNYDRFHELVLRGQRTIVTELFETSDVESKEAQLDEIILQIRNNIRGEYSEYAVNAIRVGCAISLNSPPAQKELVAKEIVGAIASYPDIQARLSSLIPAEVFALMPFAPQDDSSRVEDEYINLYSQEREPTYAQGIRLAIAESIVENLEHLSSFKLESVSDATARFQNIYPDLLLVLSSTEEAKAALVTPPVVGKAIEEMKTEEVASFVQTRESTVRHAPLIEFVLRCQDLTEGAAATTWGQKLAQLLDLSVKENDPQLEAYAHRCIDDSEKLLGKAESSIVDQLALLLRQRYPPADGLRRMGIVLTLCVMCRYCSDGQREEIKKLVVNDFVWSEPPSNVAKFMAVHTDMGFENLPYDKEVFARLANRVVTKENEEGRQQMLSNFLYVDASKKMDLLLPLLTACIQRPELGVSIPLVKQFSTEFPKGSQGKSLVTPILNEILRPSRGSISIPERKSLLELSIYLKEWHTREFQVDFDNALGKLLTSDDSSSRQLGLDIMDLALKELVLPSERYLEILRNLATSLVERKPQPDDTIMQQLTLLMEVKQNILDSKLSVRIVEYLKELIRPQVQANYRQQAFLQLSSFSGLPRSVLEELTPELVGYARSEQTPAMRDVIEESILTLRRGNSPLERDIWEDVYGHYQLLLASQDEVERQRGTKLSQQMGQITKEARSKITRSGAEKE